MEQEPGEPVQSTASLPIPPMTVAPGVLPGIYANQMRQITTGLETILDFMAVYPKQFDLGPETIRVTELGNELLARVIVPPLVFRDFVRTYVLSNPDVLRSDPPQQGAQS